MIIKEKCRGEDVEIEISRDGTLTLNGYDPQFDQAMAEFYDNGSYSKCHEIMVNWDDMPFMVVDYWLCPDFKFRKMIALDLIENFTDDSDKIYPSYANDDAVAQHQALIFEYIQLARESIVSGKFNDKLTSILHAIFGATKNIIDPDEYAERHMGVEYKYKASISSLIDAMDIFHNYISGRKHIQRGIIVDVSTSIVLAIAAAISIKYIHKEYQIARTSEFSWFARRFVDTMEAYQVGELWPPIEATP